MCFLNMQRAVSYTHLDVYKRQVFQEYNLLDTLTLEENVALPLTIKGLNPEEIDKRVRDTADKLHISDVLEKFPYQVSGGQKQRCACLLYTSRCV